MAWPESVALRSGLASPIPSNGSLDFFTNKYRPAGQGCGKGANQGPIERIASKAYTLILTI
ncbi:hypothetical protein, partial [Phyllobacterium sp. P5_D12]